MMLQAIPFVKAVHLWDALEQEGYRFLAGNPAAGLAGSMDLQDVIVRLGGCAAVQKRHSSCCVGF